MTSGTKERVELLSKLADSWIRLGQTGEGLRTDEYVNKHREAIMGIYEYCGKSLKEYLNYEPALAAVEREGAREPLTGKRLLKIADELGMAGICLSCFIPTKLDQLAAALERTAQSPVAPGDKQ